MFDEEELARLKADMMAQMRDRVRGKIGVNTQVVELEVNNLFHSKSRLIIDGDLSEEIREGTYKQKARKIANELFKET